jgi:dihydroflavonol-4-reductase
MILVTGAGGHIGNVLVRELLSKGERVRALLLPGESRQSLSGLNIEIVEGNVLDPASLDAAFKDIQDVFHLAGIISIQSSGNEMVHRVNVEGTRNILKAAREHSIRKLIYTSSIHAFLRIPPGQIIDERIPFDVTCCVGEYDYSKAEASLAVQQAAKEGLNAVLVCPTGVIGPHDYRRSEMGQVILDSLKPSLQLTIEGAYDFVDVRDIAKGEILALEKGKAGEAYILSGEQISMLSLAHRVRELAGIHAPILKLPYPAAKLAAQFTGLYSRLTHQKTRLTHYSLVTVVGNSTISHAKATQELGYAPRSMGETIADTVRWFMENKALWKTPAG